MGWTWISGEPWGWVTDHCGLWDFDASFGWYWMNPMFGCGLWEPSLVNWYGGPGWIGWRPKGPPQPITRTPAPGISPLPGHPWRKSSGSRPLCSESADDYSSDREPYSGPAGTMIAQPPFEPNPRTGPGSNTAAPPLAATSEHGFTSRPATAPPTILVGGDGGKGKSAACESWFPFRPYSLARCARHDLGRALRPGRIAGRVPR